MEKNKEREIQAIIQFIADEIRRLVETEYTDYVMFMCGAEGPDVMVVWSPSGTAARRRRVTGDRWNGDGAASLGYRRRQRFRFNNVAEARCVRGAVDLAVEVLWPETSDVNLYYREREYEVQGVRESWILDPGLRRVYVTDYETGSMKAYTLDDKVPIGIFKGEAAIDFGKMRSR